MKEKLSRGHQVEYDVNQIIDDCVGKYEVSKDFMGDCLPQEVEDIMVQMRVSKSEEEYAEWLNEARNLIECYAQTAFTLVS